jgi:hypothetical protein
MSYYLDCIQINNTVPASSNSSSAVPSSTDTSLISAPSSHSSPNIPAIVGGAVGGFFTLVVLALVLFFLRRRKSQKPDAENYAQGQSSDSLQLCKTLTTLLLQCWTSPTRRPGQFKLHRSSSARRQLLGTWSRKMHHPIRVRPLRLPPRALYLIPMVLYGWGLGSSYARRISRPHIDSSVPYILFKAVNGLLYSTLRYIGLHQAFRIDTRTALRKQRRIEPALC